MKFFYWNIRGVANNVSRLSLLNFCKEISPDIVYLAEPMMNPIDFPLNFLSSINMSIFAFNSRNDVSKI